tara:strand:+ start:1788 stop:2999 length:1212 start_codon:yes stop_codon:yes gene_type:complete
MFTGVSGLTGNSDALQVLGDNIANVNTIGYKSSDVVFGDILSTVLANGSTTMQFGRGTLLNGVTQSFEQGALETTSNATDMSVDGSGFFIVNDGVGNFYTRAGQFRMDNAGKLADPNANILQGFAITAGTTATALSDVDLAGVQSAPNATTTFTLGANLDASSASATTTFTSPITIYNSIGDEDVLSLTFTKGSGNSWTWSATSSILSSSGSLASGTVSFNTSGVLTSPTTDPTITLDYTTASAPAASQTITWDLVNASGASNGDLTGYAATSNNNAVVQDGFSTGTLIGLSVGTSGIISGLFDNGQTQELYQVGLADFLSPEGLDRKGGNLFAVSARSGQPIIGAAKTGGFGSILGSALELSNVDLAAEFVTLIQTQQAFQASSRIITTVDDLLTEAVNLKR